MGGSGDVTDACECGAGVGELGPERSVLRSEAVTFGEGTVTGMGGSTHGGQEMVDVGACFEELSPQCLALRTALCDGRAGVRLDSGQCASGERRIADGAVSGPRFAAVQAVAHGRLR